MSTTESVTLLEEKRLEPPKAQGKRRKIWTGIGMLLLCTECRGHQTLGEWSTTAYVSKSLSVFNYLFG